ncbi:MAG: UDP-2,3-diacylglucosamine diphosphatase LpxI [Nitrospirota bacterium]
MKGRKKIGIIAGNGRLPSILGDILTDDGYEVIGIAVKDLTDSEFEESANNTYWFRIGELTRMLNLLKKEGVRDVVMTGKISKTIMYNGAGILSLGLDLRALALVGGLRDRKDDSILSAIAEEIEKEGITVKKITDFIPNMLSEEGVLTSKKPSKKSLEDIEFGWGIAREIGRLDIGQTIIIKDRAVMAVEAIEGTDEAIRRGGRLSGGGAVVIKLSKPQQDMRFDVPAVGVRTIEVMNEVKAGVLAVEAYKTIIIDKEKVLRTADNSGISIVGVNFEQ